MAAPRANWSACLREALALLLIAGALTTAAYPLVGSPWLETRRTADPLAVTATDVGRSQSPVLWVDARKEAERAKLPGPKNSVVLTEERWEPEALMMAWAPPQMVVVFCDGAGCQASRKVAERLAREMPALRARHLTGGLPSWQEFEAATKGKAPP